MNAQSPKIAPERPVIRQLDEAAVNRIAAGEVVERPASAVKELIENALDAGARRIEVAYADGGKTLIRVADDGCGMTAEDLPLALARHATSKIDGSDLLNIRTFGFRGEALPSLGAVGRLRITSRVSGGEAAEIAVSGGRIAPVRPAALSRGTVVELRDLFYATPARLKFLRSDRAETQAIRDVVQRLAMAEPFVGFTLRDVSGGGEGRMTLRAEPEQGDLFDALSARLANLIGKDFADNALPIDAEREGIRLTGFAALPTYSRGAAVEQFLFVNSRPVRDKLLIGALQGRLYGCAEPRPSPRRRPQPDLRPRAGRCERPPGQGRGAVPRTGRRARPHRLGAAPRAGRGRSPRLIDRGRGDPWRDAPGTGRRRASTRWTARRRPRCAWPMPRRRRSPRLCRGQRPLRSACR